MGILSFLRNLQNTTPPTSTGPASADVAKGRLQVLIAHDRTHRNGPEYLPHLKQDIIDVIKKYANVGEDQVMVNLDTQDNRDILELNITLPEETEEKKQPPRPPENSSFADEAAKAAGKPVKKAAKKAGNGSKKNGKKNGKKTGKSKSRKK